MPTLKESLYFDSTVAFVQRPQDQLAPFADQLAPFSDQLGPRSFQGR
jgi:hypothetical protein